MSADSPPEQRFRFGRSITRPARRIPKRWLAFFVFMVLLGFPSLAQATELAAVEFQFGNVALRPAT